MLNTPDTLAFAHEPGWRSLSSGSCCSAWSHPSPSGHHQVSVRFELTLVRGNLTFGLPVFAFPAGAISWSVRRNDH
jgi:hypothetical protein